MTLTQISTLSGVPLRTLQRWRKTRPFVYQAVCDKAKCDKLAKDFEKAWPNLNVKVKQG